MERTSYLIYGGIAVLALLHLVGLVGFAMPQLRSLFQILTPFHLLIGFGVLMFFHGDWGRPFLNFVALAFSLGFGIEVLGVQTGWVFGSYEYTEVLGIQLWGVPLIIGINWVTLTYITGWASSLTMHSIPGKILLGALLMVGLDGLIEPFAINTGLWVWEQSEIPLQNFAAWFGIALVIQWLYHQLPFDKRNPIALPLLIIQAVFFLLGWLLGIW